MSKEFYKICIETNKSGQITSVSFTSIDDAVPPDDKAENCLAMNCPSCLININFEFELVTKLKPEPLACAQAFFDDDDHHHQYEDEQDTFVATPKIEITAEEDDEDVLVKSEPNCDSESASESPRPSRRAKSKTVPLKKRELEGCHVEENGWWTCDWCKKSFRSKMGMQSHRKYCNAETRNPTQCDKCAAIFPNHLEWRKHNRKMHTQFQCHLCGASFRERGILREHLLIHETPNPYHCDLCKRSFRTRARILNHMRTKHMTDYNKYVCTVCQPTKKFSFGATYEIHMKRHANVKPFACNGCTKTFVTNGALLSHIKAMHTAFEEKPKFACDQCNYIGTKKENFRNHLFTHVDDAQKPYKCTQCGKGFIKKDDVRRHELIHQDHRPFTCSYCGKTFRQSNDVKVHMRLHTGEKPYECSLCGKRFSDRGCYRSHIIVHEKQMGTSLDKGVKKFSHTPL